MVETRRSSSSGKRPLPSPSPSSSSSKRSKGAVSAVATAAAAVTEASSSTNDETVDVPIETLSPVKESEELPREPDLESADPDLVVGAKPGLGGDSDKSPDADGEGLVSPLPLGETAAMNCEISKVLGAALTRAKKRSAKAAPLKSAAVKSVRPSEKVAWGKLLSECSLYPHKEMHGTPFIVGQSRNCDLVLNDSSISGTLCKLKQIENGGTPAALLEVTGGKGAVQVNGKLLPKQCIKVIYGGDELIFSSSGKHAYVSFSLFTVFTVGTFNICWSCHHFMFKKEI